ncbi:hypothetical protein JZU71_03300, partial [bacterium]|nr:hypothetical protein [bacterium]
FIYCAVGKEIWKYNSADGEFISKFDFNGLPVISIPCGFTDGGLPIGFQIQGKPFAEAQVLQTAYAYEQAHPAIRERKCGLWK